MQDELLGREHKGGRGGCIVLLDVPPGSAIILNGVTRVTPSSSPFDNRGLCIIDDIPSSSSSSQHSSSPDEWHRGDGGKHDFHLLVVRPGTLATANTNGDSGGGGGFRRALPVGFILSSSTVTSSSDHDYHWVFARKYDRYTEEVSHEENVDPLTLRNILLAMKDDDVGGGRGELKRVAIPYERFMSSSSSSMRCIGTDETNKQQHLSLPSWEARASMIHPRFLRQCHNIISTNGSKIVPSSHGNDHDVGGHDKSEKCSNIHDGVSISYPPMPCIDPAIDARRLVNHSGTRSYLSALSPAERTRLLVFSKEGEISDFSRAENTPISAINAEWNYCRRQDSSGEYVWNDVLCRYYGDNGDTEHAFHNGVGDTSISRPECHFLADIELSFLLLLYLECQSSLEFWRDAISMCSLSVTTATTSSSSSSSSFTSRHPRFFRKLLSILYIQLSCIESDFFGDVEYSSGSDNFAVIALKRLCDACDGVGGRRRKREEERDGGRGNSDAFDNLKSASRQLRLLVHDKFGLDLTSSSSSLITKGGVEGDDDDDDDEDAEVDVLWSTTGVDFARNSQDNDDEINDIEGEDGPVVVPYDQIEASRARSATVQTVYHSMVRCNADGNHCMEKERTFASSHQREYPLLHAAMLSTGEDVVMACARILDEKNDVSLVREAAAYLEEVEAGILRW